MSNSCRISLDFFFYIILKPAVEQRIVILKKKIVGYEIMIYDYWFLQKK